MNGGVLFTLLYVSERVYKSNFCEPLEDSLRCTLCPHNCLIREGRVGVCGVRGNIGGELIALNYGRLVAIHNDPIEKKPLFHFYPMSRSLSIATIGCNLFCLNCQNYSISQVRLDSPHKRCAGDYYRPEDILQMARSNGCLSISYTYAEPTIFSEFALDIMDIESEIRHVFVTNGYMSDRLIDRLIKRLDAANIDLKSFSEDFYRRVCKGGVVPVLNTIKRFFEAGIHIEVTTLLIPTLNDSEDELREIASFLASISPEIPWHVSRYHPDYKLDLPPTPSISIRKARELGYSCGLKYVYSGNLWDEEGENTYCFQCKNLLIKREGFYVKRCEIINGGCKHCGTPVYGRFED